MNIYKDTLEKPKNVSRNSDNPLSEKELNFLLTLKRDEGANLQKMVKRVRCREQ